jgi:hypothetical protein
MPRVSLALLALALVACHPQPSPPPPPATATATAQPAVPVWVAKDFSKLHDGCTQKWVCDCTGLPARAGCHLQGTAADGTTGVCAADSGPVTACTRCMALPPGKPCACDNVCP